MRENPLNRERKLETSITFRLKVQKLETKCLFELSWGGGQQISIVSSYPEYLNQAYQIWQRAYLYFYKTQLRAQVLDGGGLPPLDPPKNLADAEFRLLNEFRRWLTENELLTTTIRQVIANESPSLVNLFLTCQPIELDRLPWEIWETIIASSIEIRIVRSPLNIKSKNALLRNNFRRGGARILAIFGDPTGINLEKDKNNLASLSTLAEIKWIVWQEGKDIQQHKQEICQALEDKTGWDILFFAGHSQENSETGGELLIAPKCTIFVKDIEYQLTKAQAKGLQFAFFNSCNGLNIASSLIALGLNQVAIMREPIHNKVAEEFLVKFIESLATYNNVYTAFQQARKTLQNKNIIYPSAYLVPSLFCHPEAEFFQLQPFGWKAKLYRLLPTRKQGILLGVIIFLSLFPPFQQQLLNGRLLIQAVYRHLTAQLPSPNTPPVLLVEIDEESILQANISKPNPMDRSYLALLIDKLVAKNAKVIGLDYLLDHPQVNNDLIFVQTIKNAVKKRKVWFVFAAIEQEEQEQGVNPNLASLSWSLQGTIQTDINYLRIPEDCNQVCPFTYLLALVKDANKKKGLNNILEPRLDNQGNLRNKFFNLFKNWTSENPNQTLFKKASGLKFFSLVNDFSLPPQIIYHSIPAWQLLADSKDVNLSALNKQVVLIASGGYREAGIDNQYDYFPIPLAVEYWLDSSNIKTRGKFTGGKVQSYQIAQWLMGHWVISIPDFLLVIIAAFFGQAFSLSNLKIANYKGYTILIVGTGVYGLLSLQLYISATVLVPWLLPSATLSLYLLPYGRK